MKSHHAIEVKSLTKFFSKRAMSKTFYVEQRHFTNTSYGLET